MKPRRWIRLGVTLIAFLFFNQVNAAPPSGMVEKVAALKRALQESKTKLKQYQWVETMTVSKGDEEKSQKQFRCYYGVDGTLQKTLLNSSQEEGRMPRGIRGKIVAHKKEELADYMQQAAGLIKQYIPPQASKIQSAMESHNVSVKLGGSTGNVGLVIQNYLLQGDSLDINLDMAKPEVTGLSVHTYLDDPKDIVTMVVTFGMLPDGTSYPKQTVLTAKKKNITIMTENAGYRKM